jgi:hypothetical protein
MDKGGSHIVDGLTIVDPQQFYIRALDSDNNTFMNIKLVSAWTHNADGIALGESNTVNHSFLRCNDDVFKLYKSKARITNTVVWQQHNGIIFQTGWFPKTVSDVIVQDVDIIHAEWCYETNPECITSKNVGVIGHINDARNGVKSGASYITNFTYERIRVEDDVYRLFAVNMSAVNKGLTHDIEGQYAGITLKDWVFDGTIDKGIMTGGTNWGTWTFDNVTFKGQCVKKLTKLRASQPEGMDAKFVCP